MIDITNVVINKNVMLLLITIAMIVSMFATANKVHAMSGPNLALNSDGVGYPSISASYTCNCGDNAPSTINGVFDYGSSTHDRWTNYGGYATDWLDIDFGSATTFNQVKLYLYNDGGGVQPPSSYLIQYWNGTAWVDTTNKVNYPGTPGAAVYNVATAANTLNIVNFDTVISNKLRVIMNNGNAYTGLVEIEVYHADRGDGTTGNPYVLYSAADFELMRNNLSANFVLANNVDLTGLSWTPIGQGAGEPYQGKFNGQGYSIKGLSINSVSNNIGLFGTIGTTGVIENLTIDGAVLAGDSLVGVLAGSNQGNINNVMITNSTVTGSYFVGGLVGGVIC